MSEAIETLPFAASGSGKSPEEVAFDLVNKLKGQGVWGEKNISEILDMYAECLDAARGLRAYAGQNRVQAQVKEGGTVEPARAASLEPAAKADPSPPVTDAPPMPAMAPAPQQAQPPAGPEQLVQLQHRSFEG